MSENGDALSFDFTEYLCAPSELAPWLADGWSGMTALGLAGSGPTAGMVCKHNGRRDKPKANFSLRFYPNGTADLHWSYERKMTLRRCGRGYWTLRTVLDGPSYLTFNLSLVGGRRYMYCGRPIVYQRDLSPLISPSGTGLPGRRRRERRQPAVPVAEHDSVRADADRRIKKWSA